MVTKEFVLLIILPTIVCAPQVRNKELKENVEGSNIEIYGRMGKINYRVKINKGVIDMESEVIIGYHIFVEAEGDGEKTHIYAQRGKYHRKSKRLFAEKVKVKGRFELTVSSLYGVPEVDGVLHLYECRGYYNNILFTAKEGRINLRDGKGIFFNPEIKILR